MTALSQGVRSCIARGRRVQAHVRRRPESVRALVVLAVVHPLALAGTIWWTVTFYGAVGGGLAPSGIATSIVVAAAIAVGGAVLVVGVWRGREDARRTLWDLGWVWVWISTLLSLTALLVPLVITAVAGATVWYAQQEDARAWTAVSPAPDPGSPPR